MNDNERAIYDALYPKCMRCYADLDGWAHPTWVTESPPRPNELAGYVIDEGASQCRYCTRMAKTWQESSFSWLPSYPIHATKVKDTK